MKVLVVGMGVILLLVLVPLAYELFLNVLEGLGCHTAPLPRVRRLQHMIDELLQVSRFSLLPHLESPTHLFPPNCLILHYITK